MHVEEKEFDSLPLANSRQGAFWKEGTAEGSWIDHSTHHHHHHPQSSAFSCIDLYMIIFLHYKCLFVSDMHSLNILGNCVTCDSN